MNPIFSNHDPFGWRESFQRAISQTSLAEFDADAAPGSSAIQAAYYLAACLGKCRLFAVDLGELDGTLPPKVAIGACEQWRQYLSEWIAATSRLEQAWSGAIEEIEAFDQSCDLLAAHMESWGVFLAVDEAYQDCMETASPMQQQFAQQLQIVMDHLEEFDQALRGSAIYLAPLAKTELLENWRQMLAPEYTLSPPWWLAGELESLWSAAQSTDWLPRRIITKGHAMSTTNANQPTGFEPGSEVALRSDPKVIGVVMQMLEGQGETRYVVFHDNKKTTYYASQLVAIKNKDQPSELVSIEAFNARLTALHLQQPGLSSLYSLHAARVDFIPYQFRPVLKFIRSDRPRLLIADGVGVGKTIEAGLILRELQARREVRTVLIVCPKSLVVERKWQSEMKRFDEDFEHLDGKTLRYCLTEYDLNGEWPEKYARAIISHSLFTEELLNGRQGSGKASVPGLHDLDPPPRFDLVIVDEAHHIHNTNTLLYQGVRFLTDHAEAAVFLTASPIQLKNDNLFTLLNALRPDLVIDKKSYEDMAAPNPHINRAAQLLRGGSDDWQQSAAQALQEAAETRWGQAILQKDPRFTEVQQRLLAEELAPADRVRSLRTVEELHTFNSLINRTRRRDIGNFTVRKAFTKSVDFTEQQRAVHDRLLDIQTRLVKRSQGDRWVKFMLTTLRRQAASCIHGLVPLMKDILARRIDESMWNEVDDLTDDVPSDLKVSGKDVDELVAQAEQLASTDPKLECLLGVINEKQALGNNKVLVFSSFRHTLRYLESHLLKAGVRVGMIHGGVKDVDRVTVRDRFKLAKDDRNAIDVLLMSEVGSEGLDYQFCDCMVNYDLPWNPMKIDQRIGRIDRNGQKSPTVAIYNLITPGTVDADIYDRCMMRIGVFAEAIGDNEEILGEISSEIRSLAEDLNLTDDERRKHLQQLADNQVRMLEEQSALEKRSAELFGIVLPPKQLEREILDMSSYWTSPQSLQNLVEGYLTRQAEGKKRISLGSEPLKTLTLEKAIRSKVLAEYRQSGRQPSGVGREWEKWLKSNEQLTLTFDASVANENRSATFITPVHPIAQQAARALVPDGAVLLSCRVKNANQPAGVYRFAVYLWLLRGVKEDVKWQPVCSEPSLNEAFLDLLQRSEYREMPASEFPPSSEFEGLDGEHHRLWTAALETHRELTSQLVGHRRESLKTSHKARVGLLKDQLAGASEGKIRRMRQSQIDSAENDYQRHMAELQQAETSADIISKTVAFGVMEIVN